MTHSPWRKGSTRRWRKLRAKHLAKEPLCRMCRQGGRITEATTVDHIIPHRGDETLRWDEDNLQSLCPNHHNSTKQQIEKRGYSTEVGADGWPLSPDHPVNR